MPRIAKELSAIEVSRIHDQGLHFVGNVPGLILQVKGASRSWILRIPVGGKRRDIGLGGFLLLALRKPVITRAISALKSLRALIQFRSGVINTHHLKQPEGNLKLSAQ